jgi:hypothetical protein
MPGAILDTGYRLARGGGRGRGQRDEGRHGPMTAKEAAGIAQLGDLTGYAPAIQKLTAD